MKYYLKNEIENEKIYNYHYVIVSILKVNIIFFINYYRSCFILSETTLPNVSSVFCYRFTTVFLNYGADYFLQLIRFFFLPLSKIYNIK
jgi:hypothetical protein